MVQKYILLSFASSSDLRLLLYLFMHSFHLWQSLHSFKYFLLRIFISDNLLLIELRLLRIFLVFLEVISTLPLLLIAILLVPILNHLNYLNTIYLLLLAATCLKLTHSMLSWCVYSFSVLFLILVLSLINNFSHLLLNQGWISN